MIYPPQMTLGKARERYFRLNNFSEDGGYGERWIKVKVWRIPVWLPNTEGRVRAVKLHDLHHVLTEYPTTWRGEAEISAWEVGAGGLCRYYAGWWLDLMNIAQGLVVNPRGVYSGFMRGRKTLNLFSTEFRDEILRSHVGEYRHRLRLDKIPEPPNLKDRVAFGFWAFISAIIYFGSLSAAAAPFIVFGLLIWWLSN
jgi:hypothetical protein